MTDVHGGFIAAGVQRGMSEGPIPADDDAARALALLEEALVLLDAAGMTLAAAELDHVRHVVEDAVRAQTSNAA